MRFGSKLVLILWSSTVLFCGCQKNESSVPTAGTAELSKPLDSKVEPGVRELQEKTALSAQKALFEALSGRLMAVLSEGTPADAIAVCSEEAHVITQRVAKEHGVVIGRTSFKLRNSKNVPPTWAQQLVADRAADPQFVDLQDGRLGALLPIRLKPTCLICHGPREQIPDSVQQQLATLYPDDQATGFAADALRGWFWVEIPPS